MCPQVSHTDRRTPTEVTTTVSLCSHLPTKILFRFWAKTILLSGSRPFSSQNHHDPWQVVT